jgi:hypothetical protein
MPFYSPHQLCHFIVFLWLFHPTQNLVRHPASLVLCRRHKATIVRAINDIPPPESTFLSDPFAFPIPAHLFTAKLASFVRPASLASSFSRGDSPALRTEEIGSGRLHSRREFHRGKRDRTGNKRIFDEIPN